LSQAVQRQKGDAPTSTSATTETAGIVIDLPLAAYLPGDWIPEMALRLQMYRRIAGLNSQTEIDAMREELLDRFGQLPVAVDGLLYQIEVKLLAQAAGATHILARGSQVQIKLPYLGEINRQALEQRLGDDVSVSRVAVTLPLDDDQLWKLRLLDVLGALAAGVQAAYGK
ncbi:MAG: TRCF domain-containing protein, partial [Phototrophicaceae bacterium]